MDGAAQDVLQPAHSDVGELSKSRKIALIAAMTSIQLVQVRVSSEYMSF